MNVFDEEMELLDEAEAVRIATLVSAGLTREEYTAYERLVGTEGASN